MQNVYKFERNVCFFQANKTEIDAALRCVGKMEREFFKTIKNYTKIYKFSYKRSFMELLWA